MVCGCRRNQTALVINDEGTGSASAYVYAEYVNGRLPRDVVKTVLNRRNILQLQCGYARRFAVDSRMISSGWMAISPG